MRIKAMVFGLFFAVVGMGLIWFSLTVAEPIMWGTAAIGLVAVGAGPLLSWLAFKDFAKKRGSTTEILQDASDLLS